MKSRKAPGQDGITNVMIKRLPKKAIVYLTYIFNAALKFAYFPKVWKKSKIIAIAKPNKDKTNPANYRPISLLSAIGKLFEKMIADRINKCIDILDSNQGTSTIIPYHQFGFRQSHSCDHQIQRLVDHIKFNRSRKKSTGLITLDIEKAFDCVWHDGLLAKLLRINLPLVLVKIIKCFLNNRSSYVHHQESQSDWYNIVAGVPQGSILSPLLYNIFVSDIPQPVNCNIASFADDTAIFTSDEKAEEIMQNLERGYTTITNFFEQNKIKINASKTNSIKYLGIHLDERLTFKKHISLLESKINKIVKTLYSLLNKKSYLTVDKKLLLFKTTIQPILLYGCPCWGSCAKTHINKIQIIQNKLLKMILNKHKFFRTTTLHSLGNVKMISEIILQRKRKFHWSVIASNNPLITNLST